MKRLYWLLCIVVAGFVLAGAGCKKSGGSGDGPAPYDIGGVKIDMPKLREAFVNSTPEQQACISGAASAIRYSQPTQAMMQLDKLLNTAGITEDQKKLVTQVIDQVKQLATKSPQ